MKISINLRRPNRWEWFRKNYIYLLGILALVLSLIVGLLVFAHFQLGWDLWWLKIQHAETAAYWGQIGDFIGGILNPLLSFCALIAVLYNLSLQREELALARKDAKDAQEIQSRQSAIFKQQNFESVFFRLLEVHSNLSRNMKVKAPPSLEGKVYEGADAFDFLVRDHLDRRLLAPNIYKRAEDQTKTVLSEAQSLLDYHVGSIGHYFKNIYQILKYVDSYGDVSFGSPSKSPAGMEIRRAARSYRAQRVYANILRAQLSSSEVACLFLNCLSAQGDGLKYYVEKYSMLKTFEHAFIGENPDIAGLYNKLAYADYEEIEMADIISHIQKRYDAADDWYFENACSKQDCPQRYLLLAGLGWAGLTLYR